jgi:hypothetical protein
VPNTVLRTGGLTDISGLVGLAKNDLVHLAFRNNTIVDASPLAAIPSLEFLDLSLNEITDISALSGAVLIDDGDVGYAENSNMSSTGIWFRNQADVPTAFGDDYRRQSVVEGPNGISDDPTGDATWTFSNLVDAEYDVFVTWHAHEDQASNAFFTIDGAGVAQELEVNQKLDPVDDLDPGNTLLPNIDRPFELLGRFRPDTNIPSSTDNGEIKITLSDFSSGMVNSDGTVVADAVILRAVNLPLPNLDVLNLHHNPLNNHAFDLGLPILVDQLGAAPQQGEVIFDLNHAPELTGLIGPQHASNGSTSVTVPNIINQLGITDPGNDFLLVGAFNSTEIARFNGQTDSSPGTFAESFYQFTDDQDPFSGNTFTGGAYGLNGNLYVAADLANSVNRVVEIDGTTGEELNATDFFGAAVSMGDLATSPFFGGRVHVATDDTRINHISQTLPSSFDVDNPPFNSTSTVLWSFNERFNGQLDPSITGIAVDPLNGNVVVSSMVQSINTLNAGTTILRGKVERFDGSPELRSSRSFKFPERTRLRFSTSPWLTTARCSSLN